MYEYWSNKTKWHEQLLLLVIADNIAQADEIFESWTGFNPTKNAWIGCVLPH